MRISREQALAPFHMRLQGSRIIVAISKRTGEIVCGGVANDEG
jgi:hypothetical protein